MTQGIVDWIAFVLEHGVDFLSSLISGVFLVALIKVLVELPREQGFPLPDLVDDTLNVLIYVGAWLLSIAAFIEWGAWLANFGGGQRSTASYIWLASSACLAAGSTIYCWSAMKMLGMRL